MDRLRKSSISVYWILLVVNIPGIALFLYFASGVWAPRGQEGLYYDAGDLSLGAYCVSPSCGFRAG